MRRFRAGSLRFRIASAFFVGALVVSGAVAASTYALVQTFLVRQRTDVVVRQSFNSLRFANEYLARPSADRSLDQLVEFLQARGTADVLLVSGATSLSSSVSVTEGTVPADLRAIVSRDEVGYVRFQSEDIRRIAFGSPVPNTAFEAYLLYPLDDLDSTLALLSRILFAVVGGAVVVAAAFGLRLAGRTIQPVRRASEAAQRVAEGLLETRLEETGRDELGVLAASFNEMAAALQERITRERRFVADASHELRTPLTGLKTAVDYLAERSDELGEPHGRAAKLASQEVQDLERLIDDLLELTRVEAGGVQVSSVELDVGAFAREVVRRRAPGIDVTIDTPDGLVVKTDKMRLERVVGNLLENAASHGRGSDVRLRVWRDPDDHARFVVSDRGPGIQPQHLPRIYERFWRADEARRRSERSGAGLGLAIARENAHVIGGELTVRSTPGEGSIFELRLPITGAGGPL